MQHSEKVWKCFGTNFRNRSRREFTKQVLLGTLGLLEVRRTPVLDKLPRHKFRLGQKVIRKWINDDTLDPRYGTTHVDCGVVVGVVYQMPGIKGKGWTYWVKWYEMSIPTVALPHTDCALESELQNRHS